MARCTYVFRNGELIPKEEAAAREWVHGVRPDGMDATECPADGRTYDSRSAYYAAVERSGGYILGSNERPPSNNRPVGPSVHHSMRQALEQLKSR